MKTEMILAKIPAWVMLHLALILAAVEGYYYRIVGGPTPFEGRVEVTMKLSV